MKSNTCYIETYGCQMNVSDSEVMAGVLNNGGLKMVPSPEQADVILVNACSIREHAEQRVLGRLGQLYQYKLKNPEVVLGVTGCMAQSMKQELLKKARYLNLVVGPDGYRNLGSFIKEARESHKRISETRLQKEEMYDNVYPLRFSKTSAWVTVARGCDKFCTYCIVPFVRGREKSRTAEDIISEVRDVAEQGMPEVVLLGQNINSYNDGETNFAQLISKVAKVDGIRRIRFVTSHPIDLTEEMVKVMATEEKICKNLHLPFQSGSNKILESMLRLHTREQYLEKISFLREMMPGIGLSTDIIVGFPNESEEDFQDTVSLMQEVVFDHAFTFMFSPRRGTKAASFADQVDEDVKKERLNKIIEIQRHHSFMKNHLQIGKEVEVLVEQIAKRGGGKLSGKTDDNRSVVFPGRVEMIGTFQKVRIIGTSGETLFGNLAENHVELKLQA